LSNTILRVWQYRADGVEIRPVHIRADGRDGRALPASQLLGQQRGGRDLRAVVTQSDHLAVNYVREHRPEALSLPALNLVESEVAWLPFRTGAIPLRQERQFRPARFTPAHAVSDGRMTCRHRLTVHADLLPQPTRDARLPVREFDPLCANAAAATDEAALPIDQRDGVGRPWQIIQVRAFIDRTRPSGGHGRHTGSDAAGAAQSELSDG